MEAPALATSLVAGLDLSLYLLPLPLILLANLAELPAGRLAPPLAERLRQGSWAVLALIGAGTMIVGLGALATGNGRAPYVLALLTGGVVCVGLISEPARAAVARILPIDPASPLDALALALTVVMVSMQIGTQLSGDVLAQVASTAQRLGPADLVLQEIPFLLAGLLGVGLLVRRSPGQALARLGLVRPEAWQVVLALAAAGVFYAFSSGMDVAAQVLTPGLAHKVTQATDRIFGQLNTPLGIATIALSAGICEETLFRGALQPRLGLLWTAIVFAVIHSQYGLSLDALAVFLLAIGLGLLRRFTNTTTTIVCHTAYNAAVGAQLGQIFFGPSVVVEAVLLAVLGGFLIRRQGLAQRLQT